MEEIICPRCKRPVTGWLLKRADVCSPKDWATCIRQPEAVMKSPAWLRGLQPKDLTGSI